MSESMYGLLADPVVALHAGYVGYVVAGQGLILLGWALGWKWVRYVWFRLTHLLAIAIVVYEELQDIRCPLSVWEESLRILAGQESTGETFLGRMLHSLLFYDAPPWVFTVGYLGFGSLVLLTFVCCRPRVRRSIR